MLSAFGASLFTAFASNVKRFAIASVFLRLHVIQNPFQLSFCSSSFYSFSSVFLDGQTEVIFIYFSNCWFKRVWPGSEILIWYGVYFQIMSFRDKQ